MTISSKDDTLYLAENNNEKSDIGLVSAWWLGTDPTSGKTTITFRGNLISKDYDAPATVALDEQSNELYTVNGRFVTVDFLSGIDAQPDFDQRFQIVAVHRFDFDISGEKGPTMAPTMVSVDAPTNSPTTAPSDVSTSSPSFVSGTLSTALATSVSVAVALVSALLVGM